MEFFENQVGEVRYLTNLADAPNTIPPISPGSSLSPGTAVAPDVTARTTHRVMNAQRENTSHPKTDKKSKKQAPAAKRHTSVASASASATTPSHSHLQAPGAAKRKASDELDDYDDDDEPPSATKSAPQQRSKRNRYISIACNECKRRKIKCNGETPCQRCGHLNLQCLYAPNCCSSSVKDSEEFKQMAAQISHLQEQVDSLFSSMNALKNETGRSAPVQQHDRILPMPSTSSTPSSTSMTMPSLQRPDFLLPRQPTFRGPTSNHFSLDVAKNTLHKMGYTYPGDGVDGDGNVQDTPGASPKTMPQIAITQESPPLDVLWEFGIDEMIRLCQVYQEEVGVLYPVLQIDTIIRHARTLHTMMMAAKKNGLTRSLSGQDGGIKDANTLLLKIVLCGGLLVEGHGSSVLAQKVFDSIKPIANRMLMSDLPTAQSLPFLALVAGFYFLSGDEVLCSRVIGQVFRLAMELGLHRRDGYESIPDEEERRTALHTFWSVYVLDRRWSFSAGLPFSVNDEEIDPSLPYPDNYPFMETMVTYARLSSQVWRVVRAYDFNTPLESPGDDIDMLDQRIKKWYSDLPVIAQLEMAGWEDLPQFLNPPSTSRKDYDLQRLQIWSWLRLNQIRIWLITPILHTHSSIMDNLGYAEIAVKLAKNTIRYLTHLNNTTNLYRKMQIFYHQFLSSAITVLFVASCHAPVNFSSSCRDEFYMALDLVKDMSAKSWVSKRLWGTVKSLRDVAPRFGLAEDPHSSAALTMAGLATGHGQAGTAAATGSPFGNPHAIPASSPSYDGMQNGLQMSSEMSRIFEGVSGKSGQHDVGLGNGDAGVVGPGPAPAPAPIPYPPRNSVYPPFRDSF
ncbi:fungal-specific transcription factor domain-containing protein [Xylariaceae sp. FL1272]|nr:fungal-specific transcription factor domain-containing protein [Xylariaceae sp. FL1272]